MPYMHRHMHNLAQTDDFHLHNTFNTPDGKVAYLLDLKRYCDNVQKL